MLPGPFKVYKCPNCTNLIYRGSLMSGNTSGAKSYSDGYRYAPMLPTYPQLVKCSICNTIFWIEKAEEKGSFELWFDLTNKTDWKNAENARFLSIEEYFQALALQLFENKEEEVYIRKKIWWSYNDRVRKGEELYKSEEEKVLWTNNVNRLIDLLDENEIEQKIMIAELNRNLSKFEKCMSILRGIENPDFNRLKVMFEVECNKINTLVFQLN